MDDDGNHVDNDVVIVNKTIPEVVISDNSCDCSFTLGDINISLIENDMDVKPAPRTFDRSVGKVKHEEEPYDFVVIDDDDPSALMSGVEIKREHLDDYIINIEQNPSTPNGNLAVKLEAKSESLADEGDDKSNLKNCKAKVKLLAGGNADVSKIETKINAVVSEILTPKLETMKTKTNVLNNDKSFISKTEPSNTTNLVETKLGIISVKANPDISSNNSIALSSSNETFIMQLDTTDSLDTYVNENDSNVSNPSVATAKLPEADSLILTADEDLETEMSLAVKDKSDKMQNNIEQEKSTESDLKKCKLDVVSKEADKTTANIVDSTSKSNSMKPTADLKKHDVSNTSTETNKSASGVSGKVENKSDTKKVLVSNGKKSDAARILWVSNVTQSVKATDLKQYISKVGKVTTAKVVTDGKKCYGYVVMENPDDANECLKTLNNSYFEGKKIYISFNRPPKGEKTKENKEPLKLENEKPKPQKEDIVTRLGACNETDDVKSKPNKERQPSKPKSEKRRRSRSRGSSKRHSSRDPLTTKFGKNNREHFDYRKKSRSTDHDYKNYLREKIERDRLKRRLIEEQHRSRDEMVRQMQREEKQREVEFRLEQERRKLQLERELFERERRELTRLDGERRKIEKERLEVLQQRTKLEQEFQKSQLKRKADEFNLSSTIVKPQEPVKIYDNRKEVPKPANKDFSYRKPFNKFSDSKHPYQQSARDNRDDRKITNDAKSSAPVNHRNVLKIDRNDFKSGKDNRDGSKNPKRGGDFKTYQRSEPPPPKLNNDMDGSAGRKTKHSDHKHDYSDGKSHCDRKPERGGRKIEVIDRKYYSERPTETSDRKHERIYRKPEIVDRKPNSFPERKYEHGREVKRYREENYPDRDNNQRTQWSAPVNYNDPWKPSLPSLVTTSSPVRYQEGNFSAASYGGPRVPPFYYHPTPPVQEYPRYDHCPQVTGRKY